jgi:hypothetical protein
MAKQAKAVLKTETLEAIADRGYFSSLEILACHEVGITVSLPMPQTSGAKSDGRFGKQDFVYLPEEDAYRWTLPVTPAVEKDSVTVTSKVVKYARLAFIFKFHSDKSFRGECFKQNGVDMSGWR